ncbi:MAG: efflux RND transporter periplasmic adaptor subunit [Rehaibacterium terrae]|uniref:efflux RND transporter periplasmic adaptor subunit n=1 Tax=Rehaibacterium terrae TaxID=1341696 RepID=UPI00391C1049
MKHARRIRYFVVAAIVAALLLVAVWPTARLVDTGTVDRGLVRETFDAEGRTRLRDRYVVSAPVAAMARRLALEPGDTVAAGQVLVTLDPVVAPTLDARARAEAQARVAAARARLDAAREETRAAAAAAAQAIAEDERQQALLLRRLVAVEAAERAHTARQRAEREAASARFRQATAAHELQAAQAVLTHGSRDRPAEAALELTAPVAGVVLRRHYESARPVQAGEALIEIGDPAGMEVEVDVLSADAVRLREGMRVELLRWGEAHALEGRVRRIEPGGFTKFSALGVEEQRVWVMVELVSPREDWQRLGEAYRVNARFVLREADDVLRVPGSAVFRHGEGHAVFRIDGRRARLVPVRTGLSGGGLVEIVDGLQEGQRVIVHPDRELEDGDRVRARSR